MDLIFKSKLYRETALRSTLFASLALWALLASYFALSKTDQIYLIGVGDSDTRLIVDQSDRILQNELKNFLKSFLNNYFSYSSENYTDQMDKASDLMSQSLWDKQKTQLEAQKEKLKSISLTQIAQIESIDQVAEHRYEAVLKLTIKSRIGENQARIRVSLKINQSPRTTQNPWGYEIDEVSDVSL